VIQWWPYPGVTPLKDVLHDRQEGQLCTSLLSETTVAFLGTGRSLSKIEFLASSGVGHFVLVDGGSVERENIGQSGFLRDDIGQLKAHVAAKRVRRINPRARVQMFVCRDDEIKDLNTVLANIDLIIDGTDSLSAAIRLSRSAFQLGVDALHIRTEGDNRQYVIAGTLRNAAGLGCLRCFLKSACDRHEAGHQSPPFFNSHRIVPETLNVKAAWVALGLLHYRAGLPLSIASVGKHFAQLPCWIGLNGVDAASGNIFPIRAYREPLPMGWRCPVCGTSASAKPPVRRPDDVNQECDSQ
jgi:molybdopterin/thiamine biosynthesis adenylyltransferase